VHVDDICPEIVSVHLIVASEMMMKNALLAFVAGSIFSFVLGAHTEEAATQATTAGSPGPLVLTVHDASNRTFQVAGVYNTLSYGGSDGALMIDYDSDQFLCSGFGN
jgi:hypothetical protein